MDSKITKRVVPVGVIAALLMGFVLLLEGALMSGILENRSSGLTQFVPGFSASVEKEGAMKEAVRLPAKISPSLQPKIESVPANVIENSNSVPESPIKVDPSIPVG
ncbi:MAG: hypothetical protein ACJZ85_05450 [Pontiellaceae bacterium]|tara:strand:- start:188 stop:505 length:318 start_codon:yes stop_codon:yes gene_type:complete